MSVIRDTARELVAPGKGILAADESTGTIKKRFDQIGVESTEENRRRYRQMLFTTPRIGDHVSGVILYDETIRQAADDGTRLVEVLEKADVIPGIKVDTGAKALALFLGETVTEGLDGLRERLAEYRELGARFAKWRATLFIGEELPTDFALDTNAHAMARYAALCQEAEIVPIVEPEVLMDGDHHIDACEAATGRSLDALYAELAAHRVDLPSSLLKVNMVLCGKGCPDQASHSDVAQTTVRTLRAHVPAEVPGVVFLSGGMSEQHATIRLNEMNKSKGQPWQLSFSYGRALQQSSLTAWSGDATNLEKAQGALRHRAKMNGLARAGEYSSELENSAAEFATGQTTPIQATVPLEGVRSMRSSTEGVRDEPVPLGTILLIDDEQRILNFVRRGLEAEGMHVDPAQDGEEGLRLALSRPYDLVILDLVMPGLDGHVVLERILEQKPSQPVLVLSALNDTSSKVNSLEGGAEDYISKPFSLEELLARVRARLRSAARPEATRMVAGSLSLDLIRREADAGSGPSSLSEREFLLLCELVRNAGRTVSKERLLSSVWGYHFDPRSNVVDVCIRRVRAKLGPEVITTVRGVGYRIDAD